MSTDRTLGTTTTTTPGTTPTSTPPATPAAQAPRRRTARTTLLAAGALAAALVLTACGSGDAATTGGGDAASAPAATVTPAPTSDTSAEDHNAADVMFATMMIPHHAEAVEMASTVLAKGDLDPRVAALAEQVRAAQAPEIDLMSGWLRDWDEPVPDTSMPGMDMGSTSSDVAGGMSAEDMQALQDATGDDASRLFLEQMTEHHDGAIEMAQAEITDGRFPAAVDLARGIASSQQDEITQMRALLDEL